MKRDRIIGIGTIIVALFFLYHTKSIRVPANIIEPGPRLVPYIAIGLMIICSIGMIIGSYKKEEKEYLDKAGWKRLGVAYGTLFLYAIGLTLLGFVITTPFMAYRLITMLKSGNPLSVWKKIIISILITAFLYVIFSLAFGVMLPQGNLVRRILS